MSSDIAIRVQNLGKCYHIYDQPQDRLKQALWCGRKQFYREFWALNDVAFEVKKGQSVGIIGRNGSGKSTLLQLLCQTLTPTKGEIEVNGRVAALLELGAGFNPEFTGRENVYMNGAIIGLNQQEITERFDDIAAFADIGEFIDQPVKTYSSGMFVRLAFAVQACVDPDILIVDEALSVGDIFFQQKCAKRMAELREKGVTLVFVSHDMSLVRDLCESVVYLKQGRMMFYGDSVTAIEKYFRDGINLNPQFQQPKNNLQESKFFTQSIETFKKDACWINDQFDSVENKDAKLLAVNVVDEQDVASMQAEMGDKLKFRVLYQVFTENPIHVTVILKNRYDQIINSSGSYTAGTEVAKLQVGDFAIFELEMACMIEAGNYTFSVMLSYATELPNRGVIIDETPWIGPINIVWDYENTRALWFGMFGIPFSSRFIALQTSA